MAWNRRRRSLDRGHRAGGSVGPVVSGRAGFGRIAGLGSAKESVRHWLVQRFTAIALIPLGFPFVYVVGAGLGQSRDAVIAEFANPVISLLTMLFLMAGFYHLQQGLQVVIEDYVHTERTTKTLLVLNTLLCWVFAVIGVFAVAWMWFGLSG